MKYHYQKRRRNYHIKTVIYVTLAIIIGLLAIDCIFNYGKVTIEIIF